MKPLLFFFCCFLKWQISFAQLANVGANVKSALFNYLTVNPKAKISIDAKARVLTYRNEKDAITYVDYYSADFFIYKEVWIPETTEVYFQYKHMLDNALLKVSETQWIDNKEHHLAVGRIQQTNANTYQIIWTRD